MILEGETEGCKIEQIFIWDPNTSLNMNFLCKHIFFMNYWRAWEDLVETKLSELEAEVEG